MTVLTSLSDDDVRELNLGEAARAIAGARQTRQECGSRRRRLQPSGCGADQGKLGRDFLAIVPGVRPEGTLADDQKRTATPAAGAESGADLL